MATQRLDDTKHGKVWTVAEAKARLSEILRLAESEGPQRIGVRKSFVIVPERESEQHEASEERLPMGRYLLERMPRDIYSDAPYERGSERPIPFVDYATDEEWTDDEDVE